MAMKPLLWRGQLSHIALRCADVDASARFYRDAVGMSEHAAGEGRRLGWGAGQHALDLLPGKPRLDHFGLEIAGERELDALLERVRSHDVPVDLLPVAPGHPASYLVHD